MKKHNLLYGLSFLFLLCWSMQSCESKSSPQPIEPAGIDFTTEISFDQADSSINRYIDAYGETGLRYLKGMNNDSVIIPRFFMIDKEDLKGILDTLHERELFYISMGAKLDSATNTYVSDLIFHYEPPSPSGHLASQSDLFFDVTMPCPNICDRMELPHTEL